MRVRGKTTSFPVYRLIQTKHICLKQCSLNTLFRLPLPVTSKLLAPVLNFIQEQTADSLELTEENVIDVTMLADFLDVADVVEECCE